MHGHLMSFVGELQSCRTRQEMTHKFVLDMLPRCGPTAFERFLKCLVLADEVLHGIAAQLDPDAPARYSNT